jgi:hypothetical protein
MEPTMQNNQDEAKKTLWMTIIAIIIIVLLIGGAMYMYRNRPAGSDILVPTNNNSTSTPQIDLGEDDRVVTNDERAAVAAYLKARINELSPRKAAVGRSFEVTSVVIEAAGRAVVGYTDGITTRDAAVSYSVDSSGTIVINSFDILQK